MATLRVVSWNIRAAIGTGPFPDRWWRRIDADRLRAIGAFLSDLEADVIALQEVAMASRGGDLIDNAGDLARQLGMTVRYGAVRAFEVAEGGAGLYGNALLSRVVPADTRVVELPRAPMDASVEPAGGPSAWAGITYADAPATIREPRCLLVVTVAGVRVGVTHLSHIGSGERRLQATAVTEAFGDATPALLLGDLNAPIEAPELAPLAAWTDAFAEPAGNGARTSTDNGWRVDHVLVRGASVSGAARVLTEAGDLSDHFPVVAEILVPSPREAAV